MKTPIDLVVTNALNMYTKYEKVIFLRLTRKRAWRINQTSVYIIPGCITHKINIALFRERITNRKLLVMDGNI